MGSLFEREIIEFHSTFSRHGNAQASLTLLIWLNEKVQKLISKINRATRRNYSWESLFEREIFQNHIKIKQNRGAGKIILVSTPKGILFLQRPNGRKLFKN